MSIVFASITPHPPVLIENLGKENIEMIKLTKQAMSKLGEKLESSLAERIIVISPHGLIFPDSFSVNISDKFVADFEDFGDFTTKLAYKPDFEFITLLKERATKESMPLRLVSEKIDYGTSIPLKSLCTSTFDTANLPLTSISYSGLSYKKHFEFGQMISDEIFKSNKRTAIICSGDLSHKLLKNSPAGYLEKAKDFDQKFIDLLSKNDTDKILKLNPKNVDEIKECGFLSIIVLLGILSEYNVKFNMHSYEYPFGVGYLVADYDFL